jgi:hypothetical protein
MSLMRVRGLLQAAFILGLLVLPATAWTGPPPVGEIESPSPARPGSPLPGEPAIQPESDRRTRCGLHPFDGGCPYVARVYEVRLDPGDTGFGAGDDTTLRAVNPRPAATATRRQVRRSRRAIARAAGLFEDVCNYSVHNPSVGGSSNRYIWSSAHLVCGTRPGKFITFGELGSVLQRNRGGWENLDSDYARSNSSSFSLQNYVSYDCHHQGLYTYRNDSWAYVIINGSGFYVPKRPSANHTCWP